MAATQNPPTREQGTANTQGAWPGLLGGILRVLEEETNRDLAWPTNVRLTYPAMLNDAQLHGLYVGATLPIRSWDWRIDPNGAPPEMVAKLAADLNMDVVDQDPQPRRMSQGRFQFDEHLETALRGILYGHYFFEQVAEIRDDGPAASGGKFAHLRKLAERPPKTLWDIFVAADGGLDSIRVPALDPTRIADQKDTTWGWMGSARLYADQVVAYVWDREGANWKGRSMLRPCYRPWKIKDRILAVGAINIERAGGVPYIEAPPGADQQTMDNLHAIASAFRVGAGAGAALPHGAQLKFAAAAGGDQAVNYVKLQNEEMARSWLMMFMQLGQTSSGSRALGSTFVDYFRLAQEAIAKWFAGVFNKHVIEDWVRWNYMGAEYAPLLVFKPLGSPVDELGAQIEGAQGAGALPEGSGVAALAAALGGRPGGRPSARPFRGPVAAAELSPAAALVDWDGIERTTSQARAGLVDAWQAIRSEQVAALAALIQDADGDLDTLAGLRAPTLGASLISDAMAAMADFGVQTAQEEADAQGVTLPDPWNLTEDAGASGALGDFLARPLSRLRRLVEERSAAIAEMLAGAISETASRRALEQTGDAVTPAEVAAQVVGHLEGLTNAFLEEQLGAAITQGFNGGRRESFRGGPEGVTRIEASSLLDRNVCTPCSHADGHVYPDLGEAEQQFPVGGNKDCEGGPRCRCTLVAVYDEAPASVF